jgi:hypothetical protein
MEERVLSGSVLFVLSLICGAYGVRELFLAYRAGSLSVWIETAIRGGSGVIVSGCFAVLIERLFR